MQGLENVKNTHKNEFSQLAGAAEYTDGTSAEG